MAAVAVIFGRRDDEIRVVVRRVAVEQNIRIAIDHGVRVTIGQSVRVAIDHGFHLIFTRVAIKRRVRIAFDIAIGAVAAGEWGVLAGTVAIAGVRRAGIAVVRTGDAGGAVAPGGRGSWSRHRLGTRSGGW